MSTVDRPELPGGGIVAVLRAELRGAGEVEGARVLDDEVARNSARSDKSGLPVGGMPACVVEAATVADVQTVLRLCTAYRVPVVPRGAGSGLASGASGTEGSVVLSVASMRRIIELDAESELAVVEPGVLNAELNERAAAVGLRFAPDPASAAISTIGGNIATNAGGLRCVKYGVTREAVLGLDVVLADGRLISTGHRTVKGVTGYDLTSLMVGSEGTLGIIVGATVRLTPIPAGQVATLGAVFPDVPAAARAAAAVMAAGARPSMLELMDRASLAAIARLLGPAVIAQTLGGASARAGAGAEAGSGAGAFLLVQFDGAGAAEGARSAGKRLQELGAAVRAAGDPADAEQLVAIRRSFHGAMERDGQVLIEDVAVPRSRLADMFAEIERISARHGVAIPTVAHAGDGNLHPNFVFQGSEVPENVWAAADDMFRAAIALGGTLTGEHGVGLLKARWLREELGDDVVELQRGIKTVFDPHGILNPGKVFGS